MSIITSKSFVEDPKTTNISNWLGKVQLKGNDVKV